MTSLARFAIRTSNKNLSYAPGSLSGNDAELGHFTLLFAKDAKKCTKIYNARAQLLFCSLNLLFGDVLAAVVDVVCLSSLLASIMSRILGLPRTTKIKSNGSVLYILL